MVKVAALPRKFLSPQDRCQSPFEEAYRSRKRELFTQDNQEVEVIRHHYIGANYPELLVGLCR